MSNINRQQPDTTIPKPPRVKVYTALISQTGTATPTVVILQNTLGTVTWARTGVGEYTGTTDGLLTADKTSASLIRNTSANTSVQNMNRADVNSVQINTNSSGTPFDGLLGSTLIEIKVYE